METYISRIHRHGDRIMSGVACFLFVLSLALAPLHETWWLALTVGLGLALASTAATVFLPARLATRILNAIVFIALAALLIQQMHGMIEMHFGIFVLLAFLLFYRDWVPVVVALVTVVVHHFGFYFLQSQGAPVYVFPQISGIGMVFVHAAFAGFEAALLVYMAIQSRREASDVEQVSALGSRIAKDGTIDLYVAKGSATGYLGQRIEEFVLIVGNAVNGTRMIAADVQAASKSMAQVTTEIRTNSERTSGQASVASGSAAEVSRNVAAVASGSEGILISLRSHRRERKQGRASGKKCRRSSANHQSDNRQVG